MHRQQAMSEEEEAADAKMARLEAGQRSPVVGGPNAGMGGGGGGGVALAFPSISPGNGIGMGGGMGGGGGGGLVGLALKAVPSSPNPLHPYNNPHKSKPN